MRRGYDALAWVTPSSRATSAALIALPVSRESMRTRSGCATARRAAVASSVIEPPKTCLEVKAQERGLSNSSLEVSSAAAEPRLPLLAERAHALGDVLGAEQD